MEYFPGRTSLEILQKIQEDLQDRNFEPEDFKDRIIFMSMFNDIEWTKRGNTETCIFNSEQVKNYAKRFSQGHCSSALETKRSGMELSVTHLKEDLIPQPHKWWNDSKKVTQYSRASVCQSWNSE